VTEPIAGRRYRVEFWDCCVAGELTGVLQRSEISEYGERSMWFDFGHLRLGEHKIHEVPDGD
jgi:hypothetical protein